jgi:hypothetical protein
MRVKRAFIVNYCEKQTPEKGRQGSHPFSFFEFGM